MDISEVIKSRAQKKRCLIGISIVNEEKCLDSLYASREVADVVIYSDHEIAGFETKVFNNHEEIGRNIVRDYKSGAIDQIVRGQVDDFGLVDEFKKQFDIPSEEGRITFAMIDDMKGQQFFLSLVSNPDGQDYADKLRIVDGICEWMRTFFKIVPHVAVMATCRPDSVGKDAVMTRSYEDAEALVAFLQAKGVAARNVHIELEKALPWASLIAAANGTIGNQIFRSLVYLAGWRNLLTPTMFPGKGMYEDCSRNETDWLPHIMFACALANA